MNPDVVWKHKVRVQTLQSMLGMPAPRASAEPGFVLERVPRKTRLMSLSQHENKKTNSLQARSKTKMTP